MLVLVISAVFVCLVCQHSSTQQQVSKLKQPYPIFVNKNALHKFQDIFGEEGNYRRVLKNNDSFSQVSQHNISLNATSSYKNVTATDGEGIGTVTESHVTLAYGQDHDLSFEETLGDHYVTAAVNNKVKDKKARLLGLYDVADACFARVGCFSMQSPWRGYALPVPPEDPKLINTTILYFSKSNQHFRRLNLPTLDTINTTKIVQKSRNSVFIVHGFLSSAQEHWMKRLKDAFLKKLDCDVFLVDWKEGASGALSYRTAAANTRVVAQEIVLFIKALIENKKIQTKNIHLVGHSLGAHIMSYVCKRFENSKIGRLTALDPAAPTFESGPQQVRLDKSDALFVEVVHSNAYGLGMAGEFGHVDYYMNGGVSQPGCTDSPTYTGRSQSLNSLIKKKGAQMIEIMSCHHSRSIEYYSESLENPSCIFWGHQAHISASVSYVDSLTKQQVSPFEPTRTSCSHEDCIPLGIEAVAYPYRGPVYVRTSPIPPYCRSDLRSNPEFPTNFNNSQIEKPHGLPTSANTSRSLISHFLTGIKGSAHGGANMNAEINFGLHGLHREECSPTPPPSCFTTTPPPPPSCVKYDQFDPCRPRYIPGCKPRPCRPQQDFDNAYENEFGSSYQGYSDNAQFSLNRRSLLEPTEKEASQSVDMDSAQSWLRNLKQEDMDILEKLLLEKKRRASSQ